MTLRERDQARCVGHDDGPREYIDRVARDTVRLMSDRLPLAIVVGGAPGSGKSVLTDALADVLDLPALHKDQLVHGRWRTLDQGLDLGESGVEPFFRSMELWADCGVSFVAEQTFYPGRSEPDVARRLAPRCRLIHVHCRSARSFERWQKRMSSDPLCGETRMNTLVPLVKRLESELLHPLDFGCPVFVVDTDDGYRPTLDELAAEIDSLYSRPRDHELDRLAIAPHSSDVC